MREDERRIEGKVRRGWAYAVMLFVLAPLVGEFLLGNLPITWLWALLTLAPMYGGGAILIRETARRGRLGWPGILSLGLAYAVVEEAFVTQSLFDPNYLGLRLLDYGYVPALGVSFWWTVFVLGIHVVWSTATPIALVEACSGGRRKRPWLGPVGLTVAALLFALGCLASAMAPQEEPFRASWAQYLSSALLVVLLVVMALIVGRRHPGPRRSRRGTEGREVVSPVVAGGASFLLGSAFMGLAITHDAIPATANALGMLFLLVVGLTVLDRWGRSPAWSARHGLAFAAGLTAVYMWYGFAQVPSVGAVSPILDTIGNAVFATGALALLIAVWRRTEELDEASSAKRAV